MVIYIILLKFILDKHKYFFNLITQGSFLFERIPECFEIESYYISTDYL